MTREYTYQDIDLFFEQFKKMPEYFAMQKVSQLIENPAPTSHFLLKGSYFRTWLILITAASIVTISAVLYFSSTSTGNLIAEQSLEQGEIIPPSTNTTIPVVDTSETTDQHISESTYITQTTSEFHDVETDNLTKSKQKSGIKSLLGLKKNRKNASINGVPLIIDDLTFDELRKLGFDIKHFSVFYKNNGVVFYSMHENLYKNGQGLRAFITSSTGKVTNCYTNQQLKYDISINDTRFYYYQIKSDLYINRIHGIDTTEFESVNLPFYPLATTDLNENTVSIIKNSDFELQNDTLVPIVMRFSRLDAGRNQDLIFWFPPDKRLFELLPDRYKWIEDIIEQNISEKRLEPKKNLIEYNIHKWIEEQLLIEPINHADRFILELTYSELERLGICNDSGIPKSIFYKSYNKGVGTSTKMKEIDGEMQSCFDTILYVDFLPEYFSETDGSNGSMLTTAKQLDEFLLLNDICLPVLIKSWGQIQWFSISENLWKRLPDRYHYLKDIYNKVLFTKSFFPKKDLLVYFSDPYEKLDINVTILDLNRKELEALGFIFSDALLSIDCAIDSSWIKYENIDTQYKFRTFFSEHPKLKEHSATSDKEKQDLIIDGFEEHIAYKTPALGSGPVKHLENYEKLLEEANLGYLFVGFTDIKGRVLTRMNLNSFAKSVEGLNMDLLIPVLVRESKYYRSFAEDRIFWFTPTEDFFDRLPERISKDLRQEYYMITGDVKGSSCSYFEQCKSTLTLEEFTMYPNPARDNITISFTASSEANGSIYLLDIRGSIVKTLDSKTTINEGSNEYHYSLEGLRSGIYLVAVKTESGFKTGRLIVSE